MNNIECKCLRIGNYVNILGKLTKVTSIEEFDGKHFEVNYELSEYLQPIQITNELLVKLGFTSIPEKYANSYALKIDNNYDLYLVADLSTEIYIRVNLVQSGIYISMSVTYLHELQNIYKSVMGKELEITL